MRRYKELIEPATDEWPVFPTFHLPSLYETLRTGFREEYWSANEIERFADDLTGQTEVFEVLREHELAPPSINTDGARRIMHVFVRKPISNLRGNTIISPRTADVAAPVR